MLAPYGVDRLCDVETHAEVRHGAREIWQMHVVQDHIAADGYTVVHGDQHFPRGLVEVCIEAQERKAFDAITKRGHRLIEIPNDPFLVLVIQQPQFLKVSTGHANTDVNLLLRKYLFFASCGYLADGGGMPVKESQSQCVR